MKRIASLAACLLAWTSLSAWATGAEDFRQGLEMMNRDKPAAQRLFLQAAADFAQAGQAQAAGRAYFLAGDVGRAQLWFLKGLSHQPWDPEVQSNVEVIRQTTGLAGPNRAWDQLWENYPVRWTLVIVGLIFFNATWLWAAWRWGQRRAVVGGPLLGLIGGTLVVWACLGLLWLTAPARAVVVQPSLAYQGDSRAFDPIRPEPIKAGTELRILRSDSGFIWGEFLNGQRGWLPDEVIERVGP